MEGDGAGLEDFGVAEIQVELLGEDDAWQEAVAFTGYDGRDDEEEFIDEAQFDELGGKTDAADQNVAAGFLFEFEDFVVKIGLKNSGIGSIGAGESAREDDFVDGDEGLGEIGICRRAGRIVRDFGPIGDHEFVGFAAEDLQVGIAEELGEEVEGFVGGELFGVVDTAVEGDVDGEEEFSHRAAPERRVS